MSENVMYKRRKPLDWSHIRNYEARWLKYIKDAMRLQPSQQELIEYQNKLAVEMFYANAVNYQIREFSGYMKGAIDLFRDTNTEHRNMAKVENTLYVAPLPTPPFMLRHVVGGLLCYKYSDKIYFGESFEYYMESFGCTSVHHIKDVGYEYRGYHETV